MPSTPQGEGEVLGPDGHRVRLNGRWAETKLSFLDNYLPPALRMAQRKPRRVYVDLFAGPGINRDQTTGRCYDSAALRALTVGLPAAPAARAGVAFTDAILVNLDAGDHTALTARVEQRAAEGRLAVPRDRVRLFNADANEVVHHLGRLIPSSAYAFVFADPECPKQWPWTSVEALARHAPPSTDLYALVPDAMGYNRMLAYDGERIESFARALTAFFGTDAWRELWARRVTLSQRRELKRALGALYHERVGTLWRHVERPRAVYRTGRVPLYSMLFATNSAPALKLIRWELGAVTPATPERQTELFGLDRSA